MAHGAGRRPGPGTPPASGRRRSSAGTAGGGCARPGCDRRRSRSTRSQTPVSVIGSASITKPGLTPVPSTATLRLLRQRVDLLRRAAGAPSPGTPAPRSSRRSAPCASAPPRSAATTFASDELVQSTATSGLVALIAASTSSDHLDPQLASELGDSPRSRPTLAGSMSTAPTIFSPLRLGHLPDHADADGTEPHVQHSNRTHKSRDYSRPHRPGARW